MSLSDQEFETQTFEFVTIFPELVQGFVNSGLMGKALESGRVQVHCVDPRRFTSDKHRSVDDAPFGGGAGMVMQAEPIALAIEEIERERGPCFRVLVTPSAPRFDQAAARELSCHEHIVFLCGRYEGIDDRIREEMSDASYSLGDFVLNGGEVASLAMFEAIARLRAGVLGNPESIETESFSSDTCADGSLGALLEHPQYTRPADWRGHTIPDLLRSGDHQAIARWRLHSALQRTHTLRPDLRPSADKLAAALKLPLVLAVLLPKEFDLTTLGEVTPQAGEGVETVWVGGRGRASSGQHRVRDLREARQLLRRRVLRKMRSQDSGPETLNSAEGPRVWSIELSAKPEADASALCARALGDLILCEKTRESEPHALLFIQRWGALRGAAYVDASMRIDDPHISSAQKDRKRLAIAPQLIDISQPASPQVGIIAAALGRALDFQGPQASGT